MRQILTGSNQSPPQQYTGPVTAYMDITDDSTLNKHARFYETSNIAP